jgi:prepilin-type N-terminal cleavage/methylation domain-containing protein
MPRYRLHPNAFSLVELSIVLVILGLLAGGVLSGQSLIRAAELRSISVDLQRYQTATLSFRDKYMALPGDMANATAFWGEVATGANCKTTSSTGKPTCDGNGDGRIATDCGNNTDCYERYRYWQHLANAGLIEGSYSGIAGPASLSHHVPGVNSPRSRISSASFGVYFTGTISNNTTLFDGDYGNAISLRDDKKIGASNLTDQWAIITPEEMWNIDTKLDDGRPASGRIFSYKPFNNGGQLNCADGTTSAAAYKLLHTGVACSVQMSFGV